MTTEQLLVIQKTVRERVAKDTATLAALKAVLFHKQENGS